MLDPDDFAKLWCPTNGHHGPLTGQAESMTMKQMRVVLLLAALLLGGRSMAAETRIATFAGGCFWCMEQPFQVLEGVSSVISGYTGGTSENPTYYEVCSGTSGHYEVIQVSYDPAVIGYDKLLEVFWRNIDPTDEIGQFVDKGPQYRTAVFYHDEEQLRLAEETKAALAASGTFDKPIVTRVLPATTFWPAEEDHQDYYLKQPAHYERYKYGSGRTSFLKRVWGKP